jgi:uncharacterized radical SAM superfamily Fe-S cluster-containing enzyme
MNPDIQQRAATLTPDITHLVAQKIPEYRSKRYKTSFGGCFMCSSIFVKADNHLGCSCQIGYHASLGEVSKLDMGEFVNGPLLRYIRESFLEGYEPFAICGSCHSRNAVYPDPEAAHRSDPTHASQIQILHVEPSNNCNLYCEVCLCTDERLSTNTPKRLQMDYGLFEKMIGDFKRAKIGVDRLALVGFGEPLFNSELPKMCRLFRKEFPASQIDLDTNANFGIRRAEEIADCGIDIIRLGIDGCDQLSYETYRRKGSFEKVINFARHLTETIRLRGSKTRPIWKYILFRHNDRDDQILQALSLADEIGIEIDFDLTGGELASPRSLKDIRALIGARKIGMNLDAQFISTQE